MQKNTLVRLSPPITCNHGTSQDVIYNFGLFQQAIQTDPEIATVKLADGGYQYVYPSDCHPFDDDGAGANLYDYPLTDIQHDYDSLLSFFGDCDPLVQRFKRVLDNRKE